MLSANKGAARAANLVETFLQYLSLASERLVMPSTDLQDLLRAKIASLEESAGQLKGLAEMKQRIAEDVEAPPENPERFRRKASEHKRDAIAALTAANALKAALDRRTKAEQIAVMRHYVLEFGQSASRCAKLSNSLADDDPRKKEIDDDGFTASMVVSVLNGILSDVAPEPSGMLPAAPRGIAIWARTVAIWVCGLLASAIIGGIVGARFDAPYTTDNAFWGVIAGLLVFTCGRLWMTSGKP